MESSIRPEAIVKKGPKVIKEIIAETKFPVYEEAAKKTGYVVNMTARAGEVIQVKDDNTHRINSIKVSPGHVEVGITIPPGQEKTGTTPFYDVLRELDQSLK